VKVMLALLVLCGIAYADPPWAEGVTSQHKDQAEALWNKANDLILKREHAKAVDNYKAALALWDHPKIQLNLAMALITLERYLEAADALERALRYGKDPYSDADYAEAENFKKLVDGRIGTIEVMCTQDGAQVALDGKAWFSCPGTKAMRVIADKHAVTAELAGYMTQSRSVAVLGGTVTKESIKLVPLATAVRFEYPYRRWIPWTVAAAGVVVAGAGLGVWLQAKSDADDVETFFRMECPMGCDLSTQPALAAAREDAARKGDIGIVTMAAGGAVVVTGVVLAVINRPRRVAITPSAEGGGTLSVLGRF
jgi:tetratricopeptide (TPR) repeat protein